MYHSILSAGARGRSFITGYKQTKKKRVCYFHFFDAVLASKGSNYSELISLQLTYQSVEMKTVILYIESNSNFNVHALKIRYMLLVCLSLFFCCFL